MNTRYLSIPAVLGLSLACGGFRPDLARGPHLHPAGWLVGALEGRRLVQDRNGNTKQVSVIQRRCTLTDSTQGRCTDEEASFIPAEKKNQHELRWNIRYRNGNEMILKMEDERGLLVGSNLGSLLLLDGKRRVPDSTLTAQAHVRYERLPGYGDPVLVTEEYRSWGIELGVVQTFWVRK